MRFRVIERRAYTATVIIEAKDANAASLLDGEILDESSSDSWADELLECEQTEDLIVIP
jgi:hypothetical protein